MTDPNAINANAGSSIGARLSIMMFLQFFVWGAWYVTVGIYIYTVAWSDGEWSAIVGSVYSVSPIAGMLSPLFLGLIADRFFATEKVLGVLHLTGGVLMLLVPSVTTAESPSSAILFWLLLGHMLCYMPTLGLVNTLAFANMTNREKQFPLIRVFGTIGWIVAGIVVSKIFKADGSVLQFYIAGGSAIVLGVYSFTLPHTPPPMKGEKATLKDVLCLDAIVLLKRPSFLIFMVCSTLICIPLAAYYSFTALFAGAMGFENPGFTMSFGQMAEVIFMVIMPLFFAKFGVKWMLAIGMAAWVLRYGLFSLAADDSVRWMVLGGIILHGICYDFFFVTGQIYVDKVAPKRIRGQAQGFLVLMTLGLGLFFGAKLSGMIVGKYTPAESVAISKEVGKLTTEMFDLNKKIETAKSADTGELSAAGKALQEQYKGLDKQKKAKALAASQLIDWKSVWLYPAGGALAVLVLFTILFKDDSVDADDVDDVDVAQATTEANEAGTA